MSNEDHTTTPPTFLSLEEATTKLKAEKFGTKVVYSEYFGGNLEFRRPGVEEGAELQAMIENFGGDGEELKASEAAMTRYRKQQQVWNAKKASAEAKGIDFNTPEPTPPTIEATAERKTNMAKVMVSAIILTAHKPKFTEAHRDLIGRMPLMELLALGSQVFDLIGLTSSIEDREATFQEESA